MASNSIVVEKPKNTFKPSVYQAAVFEWIKAAKQGDHLIVEAVAGSGKTTTGIKLFEKIPAGSDSAFVAFNKHIADELRLRLPNGANARTYHSLGLGTLKKTLGKIDVNNDKVELFLKRKAPNDRWLFNSVRRLVSLCKSSPETVYTDESLYKDAFMHDVELFEEKSEEIKYRIFELVHDALHYSLNTTSVVDFDDMVWLPLMLDSVSFYQHDFLFIDEVQDTNEAQYLLAMRSIKPTGNIIGVGDRKQSIYRFRGADETAMDAVKAYLNAQELPLSLSYRCPVKVGELVNTKFPEIKFEVPEWAEQGEIRDINRGDLDKTVSVNDMILCRVNADLVPYCFMLIRSGVKATIRGRDIGKGLSTLIRRSAATSVEDLLSWLGRWRDAELTKAFRLGAESKIELIKDKFETLYALTDGAETADEVSRRCEDMFSDDRNGIILSTIHRAKGLEADKVFIIRPDLIPHPRAKTRADIEQERNLEYVAITRAKKELIYVR